MDYSEASPALQVVMSTYDSTVWETGVLGQIMIGLPTKGRGNSYELRRVYPQMINAAQRFIDTGVPPLRGELDFPETPRSHSTGKTRGPQRR